MKTRILFAPLAALLTLAAAVPLRASEKDEFKANIVNSTAYDMTLTSSSLPWGKWCFGPVSTIKSGQAAKLAWCASGASGSATGTEGSLTYKIGETGTSVTLYFNVDYSPVSWNQSATPSSTSFKVDAKKTYEDCGRNWIGIPYCYVGFEYTVTANQ